MPEFPIKFEVKANASAGISKSWTATENSSKPIECAIPPVFHGPGQGYSPEGLFGISILNCIIAFYKTLCEKSNVQFSNLESSASMTMDYSSDDDSILSITEIDFNITVNGSSDPEKAKILLEQSASRCPLSNSIKCGKTYNFKVN
jgi:uncharacterized OsmC-like protein